MNSTETEITLAQLREVKASPVSFRTIRYSKKPMMKGLNLEYYPNYRSNSSNYINCLGGESFLEDDLMVLVEYGKKVLMYLPQSVPVLSNKKPKKLEYTLDDGRIIQWTPDMGTIWINQNPIIFEVKSLKWIENLSSDDKKKLFYKWEQARKWAEENNYKFMVFTNSFVEKSWRIENLRDIESQMRFSNLEVEKEILLMMEQPPHKIMTMKSIQESCERIGFTKSETTAAVCSLIYKQELYINLESEFSFKKTEIKKADEDHTDTLLIDWLNKYQFQWNMNSLEKEYDHEGKEIVNRTDLTDFQKMQEEKNRAIIKDIESGMNYNSIIKIHKISYGKYYNLKVLHQKYLSGVISEYEFNNKIIPLKPQGRTKEQLFRVKDNGDVEFHDKTFEQIIQSCLEQRNRMNIEDSWRFYKRFKRQEAHRQGLTPRTNETISNLRKIAQKSPSFSHTTHHIFITEYKRYIKIFFNRVSQKREGIKQANKDTMFTTSSTPYTNYIGEMVQIDHTPADIINSVALAVTILLENQNIATGKKIKRHYMERPMITVLEDIHTGVILGYMFLYRKPSIETDFHTICRMILGNVNPSHDILYDDDEIKEEHLRKESTIAKIIQGFHELFIEGYISEEYYLEIQNEFDSEYPDNLRELADWWDSIRVIPYMLHMDNGRDFTSKEMKEFLAKHNINAGYRPVGGSQYGGHVERVLGTLNRQAFHPMTGNTKESPKSRKSYPSEKMAYPSENLTLVKKWLTLVKKWT